MVLWGTRSAAHQLALAGVVGTAAAAPAAAAAAVLACGRWQSALVPVGALCPRQQQVELAAIPSSTHSVTGCVCCRAGYAGNRAAE